MNPCLDYFLYRICPLMLNNDFFYSVSLLPPKVGTRNYLC